MRIRKKTTLPFRIEQSSVPLNQELCLNDFKSHSHGPEKKTLLPKKCNCCPSAPGEICPMESSPKVVPIIQSW